MKSKWVRFVGIGVIGGVLFSCAPEQSQEARRREEALRDYERLNKASGLYVGYLKLSEDEIVPASVEVTVESNPTGAGEKPTLSVVLRTGLFGGVATTSKSATFDWGSNRVSASFKKPGGGAASSESSATPRVARADGKEGSLELSGRVENGVLVDAELIGPHLGRRKIVLEKSGKSLFDPADQRFYLMHWENEEKKMEPQALLTLKRRPAPEPAPGSSDLPVFPGLDASIAFQAFGRTPQTPKKVSYDPILGTLDMQLTDTAWVKLSGFTMSASEKIEPEFHRGAVLLGSATVRRIQMRTLSAPPKTSDVPPTTYLGTFQGSSETIAYKTIAYLDHDGSTGNNPVDFPFQVFPQLKLEVTICNGDEPFQKTFLKLDAVDYLAKKALFRRLSSGGARNLEVKFTPDWSDLDGTYLTSEGTSGEERPKLRLKPSPEVAKKGCAATK